MRIVLLFLSVFILAFFQKAERDPRLVGRWMMLFTKDSNGEIIKDEFYGKKYIETYTKDGKYILDPQFLRDDMKSSGNKEPLDYSLIPTFSWGTINNEILIIDTSQGSQQVRYGFSGDTLLLGYSNGNTRFLLKRK
ncbi:hypothetical protein [Algoriphagus sp.]|jgi:hypothetical protein|uniref:hypothetical protein n=1 Tax=Algoriphagus sp. TaxID=1872435 RepID=UPI002716BFC1|nr:hypothetical protein [Algoriphagus sp.]MDO8965322.1 hypothetical protein [Algoriphagus sp.]MDP3198754.1 hypothetical protein [Algoriphagus sp.]